MTAKPTLRLREKHDRDDSIPCKICGKADAPLRARLFQLTLPPGPRNPRTADTPQGPAGRHIAASPEIAVCTHCTSKGESAITAAAEAARAGEITGVKRE